MNAKIIKFPKQRKAPKNAGEFNSTARLYAFPARQSLTRRILQDVGYF